MGCPTRCTACMGHRRRLNFTIAIIAYQSSFMFFPLTLDYLHIAPPHRNTKLEVVEFLTSEYSGKRYGFVVVRRGSFASQLSAITSAGCGCRDRTLIKRARVHHYILVRKATRSRRCQSKQRSRRPHIQCAVQRAALVVVVVNCVSVNMVGRTFGSIPAKVGRYPALVVVEEGGAGLLAMRVQRLAQWRPVAQHHRGRVETL